MYSQLIITKNDLKHVSTDTVSVSVWSLPVKFNGSRIVTVDTENVKMSDYEIISNDGSTLTYKMIDYEDGASSSVTFIAHRIPNDQTALQKALIFKQPQTIDIVAPGIIEKNIKTLGKISDEDLRTIRCTYDESDNTFEIQYAKYEKTENGISFSTSNDSMLLQIPLAALPKSTAAALKLQASSIVATVSSSLDTLVFDQKQFKTYANNGCSTQIEKQGPQIQIQSTCSSKDTDKKSVQLELKATCLMQKFFL